MFSSDGRRLKAKAFAQDFGPVEAGCDCAVCSSEGFPRGRPCYSRAFLHTAFKENAPVAAQLLTSHNIAYMMRLMRTMREVGLCKRVFVPLLVGESFCGID